jgi:GGDEF domain-containing protein
MADRNENIPFNGVPESADAEYSIPFDRGGRRDNTAELTQYTDLGLDLGKRNTLGDSAVNILDTLQSLGSIPLAAVPGYGLEDAGKNSNILDQLRSPGYLAAQKLQFLSRDPNATMLEGIRNGFVDELASGNLPADVAAQVPYLLMGPAARAASVARFEKAANVLSKVAKYTVGTNEAATINRIAAFSGVIEGASAYSQTFNRATDQGLTEEQAAEQARTAGGVSVVLGAALGRLTPGFELHPTGATIRGSVLSHLSSVGGEAIVEEGGLAIAQQVTDNVLAGKDPMDGVGEQFGQAAAVSGVFSGALRSPRIALETAKEIGQGVRKGLGVLGDKATTPEAAATNAADAANQSKPTPDFTANTAGEVTPGAPNSGANAPTAENNYNVDINNQEARLAAYNQLLKEKGKIPATDSVTERVVQNELDKRAAAEVPTVDEAASDRRHNPEQRKTIDQMSPEEKSAEIARLREQINNPVDKVTGLINGNAEGDAGTTPLQRAIDSAVLESNDPERQPQWVTFDVANLGGLNDHVNNVADDANVHLRALVDIAKNTMQEAGLGVTGVRTGGDEFGFLVQGGDIPTVEAAKERIRENVAAYTQANGLDNIPHPKGKAPGLSLHIGSTQIVPIDTIESVRNRADRALDSSKKGNANVRRNTTGTPREVSRNDGPQGNGGTGEQARPDARSGTEAPQRQAPSQIDTSSRSEMTRAVLVDAATDATIESTTGEEQAAAISRKEELAPVVKKAQEAISKIPEERVAEYVDLANKGNHEASQLVKAVQRTDATKLPESAVPDNLKPAVKKLKELKDLKLDKTSNEILEEGFNKAQDSRGMRGYLQDVINLAALGIDGPNETASELERFNDHLQARAEAFRQALKEDKNNVEVAGTKTRTARGGLQDKPFIIHKLNANSMATVDRVFADAAKAQEVVDTLRQSFPKMFPTAAVAAPVQQKTLEPTQQQTLETAPPVQTAAEQRAEEEAVLAKEALKAADQKLNPEPVGETTLFRGVPVGIDPEAPTNSGLLFFADSKTQAEEYAGEGSEVLSKPVNLTEENTDTFYNRAAFLAANGVESTGDASYDPSQLYKAAANYFAKPDAKPWIQFAYPELEGQKEFIYKPSLEQKAAPAPVAQAPVAEKAPVEDRVAVEGKPVYQFAVFNGINRFNEAFAPNGTGLLANNYGDVVAALELGTEDEKQAAALLTRTVPKFVDAINKYVAKVLNSPISKNDDTKLKDALDTHKALPEYTNYVWVHLLTKTDTGYELHPAVVQSAAVAALMQMVRGAFQRSTVSQDVADENTDGLYYQWLQNVGRDMTRILGVTEDKNESLTLTDGIPKALAATVLEVLRQDKAIDVTSVTVDNKTLKNVSLNEGVARTLRETPAFAEVMRKVFGAAEDDTIHYGAPPAGVNPHYRHSRTPITKEQRTALENRQKVVHKRNTAFMRLMNVLGDKYKVLTTGFDSISKDPQLNELSRSLVIGITGEVNAVTQYNAGIEKYARENNMKPEDVPVHFSYEILRNGRSFSGYSPQTRKTLREFLTIGKNTLDLTNENHVRGLKLAIAQSLGIKTDVNTHEQILQKLDEMIPTIAEKALAVHLASTGEEVPELFQLLDRDELYEPKELHGLMTLGKFLMNRTDTAFENTLTYEIDGKTNGPFMAELLFGLHTLDAKTRMNLEQGGLFLDAPGATLATMQDYLRTTYKSADLYERVARNAAILRNPILMLAGFTSEAGSISRSAAKEAVTPLVYGSGVSSLSAVFTMRINNGLTERLRLAMKHGDNKLAAQLRGMINSAEVGSLGEELAEALDKSYADEKPQVTLTNFLMVSATTLHAGIRKALFEAKVTTELAGQRDALLLPKQYDLSRNSYNEILASLPATAVHVPNMGTVAVGESANTGRSGTRVEGAGKVNSVQISKPEIQMPGVSILALLTQAAGDAAMGNFLFQDQEQVLDVYDGIEMPVDQIDPMGVKLNDAVWQSSSDKLLDEFVPMLDWVLSHQEQLNNDDNAKTLQRLRQRFNVDNNLAAVRALRQAMIDTSNKIKAGRARLNSKPRGLNQMSGGGVPYTTDIGTPVRSETTTTDFRDGWNKSIEAGFDANNGKLDATGIRALLDGYRWKNKVHAAVWNKLRNMLPAGLLVSLAKTEAEWNQLNSVGENGILYGSVKGTSYSDTGKINLATASAETILHELVHQAISGNISQYFANINAVPAELRAPINDLHQLMKRFLELKGDTTLSAVKGFINDLLAKGDTAGAVDEMTAFVLTNEELINELQPSLFQRVVARVKNIMAQLFGGAVTEPFMDEVIRAFNHLAGGPNMSANNAVRTSPVLDKTTAAFATIAQKVARGQIKTVPKVKDIQSVLVHITSPDAKRIFKRVWMLLRMDTRSGAMEKYASTVLLHHPDASMFAGATDAVAAVMALTAADDTFRAQADAIWKQYGTQPNTAESLVDMALHKAPLTDATTILNEALDTMREEGDYNLSFLGTQTQRLDRMGNEWMETVGEKAFQASQTAPNGASHLMLGIHALTTESGSEAFGKTLIRLTNELTNQRWLQDGVASLVGSQTDTNAVYRQVNSMKANVAQTRSLFTTILPAQLKTLFPEGFDGWNHLYNHVGRVDAGVLGTSAGQMYSDDAARAKAIRALESKVGNAWDARNLAHYLVHGTLEPGTPHPLLRNARAIADNLNGTKRKAPESLVSDVDQLVTLYAIDKLSVNERARIAGYFASHARSMENVIGMLQKVAYEESQQYNDAYRYAYWKGALPLSTDPRTSVVVAGPVRGAQLEKLGYQKAKRFTVAVNDPASDLHYYVRDNAPPPVFSQGVLATVQQTSQGVNYTTASTISPEVGTIITNPRLVSYIRNNQGRNSNLVPIFNFDGDIAGYERLLDRKTVQTLTHSDNTLLHIAIGAKLGRIMEERMAMRFNKEAIDILKKQWDTGVAAGEQAQYEDVTSTQDKQIARAWEVVPPETKKALEDAFGGPVMIRKDLIANTLGYHKAGVADIYTGNASLSEETRRAFFGVAEVLLGPNSAKYLFAAELAIKEAVATAKDWIVVRSLSVAISNAMASMNLVVANGVPIKELVKSYREGMADVRAYSRIQKEIIGLTVKIAGAGPKEAERLRTIQKGKYEAIKRLAIYPLIEAGELSDLPEGLEETPKHSYLGDFSGWLNDHLRKLHPKLPSVAANAIIAKDTAFHDAISKAIQAGDFLGKWAVYKHMIKSGKSVEVARDTVRDEFISYGTNPGRFRGALEDFGVVWWSQFTLRAQKVLLRRFRKNPFSFFVSAGFGDVTGSDSPSDTSLFERGWDNSTGLDNVINAPSAHIWAKVF